MVARQRGPLDDAVAAIRARGGVAHAIAGDIGAKDQTHAIAGRAQGLVGEIAIAIHCASTLGPVPLRLLLDTECEDLAAVLETNLVGPFRLTKVLAGAMAIRGAGTIVHVARRRRRAVSALGRVRDLQGRARSLEPHPRGRARETGVRVLAVDPGEMDTIMHADAMPDADRASCSGPPTSPRRSSR